MENLRKAYMVIDMKPYIFSSTLGLVVITIIQFFLLSPDNQKLKIYFLDVGQGDSIFLTYPTGEHLLIDTGKDSKIFRSLDKVLPWYNKSIDYVLLTHGDIDHVGAMLEIIKRYEVKKVFISQFFGEIEIEKEILKNLEIENIQVEVLKEGDIITFGTEVSNSFEIISPDSNCYIVYKNENDCSLVGLLTYGEHTFLFTGDIGKKVETEIMNKIKNPLTVLKIAHHGSNNSTDSLFLDKVKPQYSVISSGENSYGHPSPEVLERLRMASSTIFNTKEDATVVASSNGGEFEIKKLFDQTSFLQSGICAIFLYGFDASC